MEEEKIHFSLSEDFCEKVCPTFDGECSFPYGIGSHLGSCLVAELGIQKGCLSGIIHFTCIVKHYVIPIVATHVLN